MSVTYTEPVSKLLGYGDCRDFREWPDYLELGFTREDVPELIRMATDSELNWADSDSVEGWSPIHTWRALGELHAEEAIEPLMQLFHELDDCDWAGEDFPTVYRMIGPTAVPALAGYLADDSHGTWPRITASHCLERIGNAYPEAEEACVIAVREQLERYRTNDPTLNAFLISYLIDLGSVASLPLVKQAFDSKRVDLMVAGDLEDVEIEFGVRERRSTPPQLTPLQKQFAALQEQFESRPQMDRRKIGRNEPCPCGSGKKYKKCCLN